MTEDKRKASDRGRKAATLLSDPILVEALQDIEMRYTTEWKSSKVEESVKRERAYVAVQLLDDLKTQLQMYVDRGKIADKQLQKDSA